MWVDRKFFDMVLADNKKVSEEKVTHWNTAHFLQGQIDVLRAQKVKDDITIDWMRHRVNALEKQNAQLLMKAAGIVLPVPEIVPSLPGAMTPLPTSMDYLPSFEDVGDAEASRLGATHDDAGTLMYTS